MRIVSTPEMKRLEEIFDPYIKRNDKGGYIPENAPEEVKSAYRKWCDLWDNIRKEEEASWWL
jgi:hypothetical protein